MAQGVRPHRKMFGVEGRGTGQHAEALPHQLQGQAVAQAATGGDVPKQRALVHLGIVEQAPFLSGQGEVLQFAREARRVQLGEFRLQFPDELWNQFEGTLAQAPQRFAVRALGLGTAGTFGQPAKFKLGFVQHDLQLPFQFAGDRALHVLEHALHPWRQVDRRQGAGQACIGTGCHSHQRPSRRDRLWGPW